MKWLEIIELRLAGSNPEIVMMELKKLTGEINQVSRQKSVLLYVHVNVKSDFAIHIQHDTKKIESAGSNLGLQIASNLKTYGLVNHNIWIESITNDKKGDN